MRIIQTSYPLAARSCNQAFGLLNRSPWTGLETELDQLFETAFAQAGTHSNKRFLLDLYEDKENTYVRAELPGVKKEDINIEFVDDFLSIAATRRIQNGEREENVSMSRSIMLTHEVQADKVGAKLEDGILTVTLPKKEQTQARKITVSVN